MLARDLTDEDIGGVFWCPVSADVWQRIRFLGFVRRPTPREDGGWPLLLILKAAPTQSGQQLTRFRSRDGGEFDGILVASAGEIHPVSIDYAVTADGQIIETGETAV